MEHSSKLSGPKQRLACSMRAALQNSWFALNLWICWNAVSLRGSGGQTPQAAMSSVSKGLVFGLPILNVWTHTNRHTHNWSGTFFTVTVATCPINNQQGARGCQIRWSCCSQKYIQANIFFKWISALKWTSFTPDIWNMEFLMLWWSWRSLQEGTVD